MMMKGIDMEINIGDMCTHCFRDTRFNAVDDEGNKLLLFVNRIPSVADATLVLQGESHDISVDGYQCSECQQVECDECGNLTLDYEIQDGKILCSECLENKE